VLPAPSQREGNVASHISQLKGEAETVGLTVIVFVRVSGPPQPVTVKVMVACPENEGFQVTIPAELIVLDISGLSSEMVHSSVPALLIAELSWVVPPPWQREGSSPPQISQLSSEADTDGVTVMVLERVTGPPQPVTVKVMVACPEKLGSHVTNPDELMALETSGLSSEMLQDEEPTIAEENCVVPGAWQRVGGDPPQISQLNSEAETKGLTVMTLVRVTGDPQPVTVNVMVACPVNEGFQVTNPVELMVLETSGLSSEILQVGVPLVVEVNCVVPEPIQREPTLQIPQLNSEAEANGVTVIVFVRVTVGPQPVTVNVIVAWPEKLGFQVTNPVELMVLETSGLLPEILHAGVPVIVEVNCVVPGPIQREPTPQISQLNSEAEAKGLTVMVFV
jgi:hypothetical protein